MERMIMVPKHLAVALAEIGETEIPGPQSNKRISEYLEMVGMPSSDEIPWCSAFVDWVVGQVHIAGTHDAAARSWSLWGRQCSPRLGSIVVLKRGSQPWMGHVGFLLDSGGGMVRLLGGNQRDRVGVNAYAKSRVITYRWSDDFEHIAI